MSICLTYLSCPNSLIKAQLKTAYRKQKRYLVLLLEHQNGFILPMTFR